MKIGYDGKRAVLNNTGLGNYSRLAVEVLSERYPDNSYILYTPRKRVNTRLAALHERPNVELREPDTGIGRHMSALWRSELITAQLKRDGIELFHGLSGELPLNIRKSGIPSVVTIHDLIFRHHPECYNPIDRKIYDYKFRRACEDANRVIAISQCTKADIINYYGIPEDKIDVVYQGCAAQFKHTPSKEEVQKIRRKYGLNRPYVLYVGTIEQRKNQILPVRGIRGLPTEIDVVLVGRRTPYCSVLEEYARTYQSDDRLKIIDNVEFEDLPALYAGAFCSTYTSRFEGFGIPVIESLSVGTPVVVAKGSCLEEAAGPMAPAVDPDDVEEWVNVVKEMINYPTTRRKIAEAGKRYVERFSDEAMAEGIYRSYQKALESK